MKGTSIMTEAAAEDMHVYEVAYTAPGVNGPMLAVEEVTALYWQTGANGRGDDERFMYFKDYRHRTVLALKADLVASVRILKRAH
jgi:hypothetical protein